MLLPLLPNNTIVSPGPCHGCLPCCLAGKLASWLAGIKAGGWETKLIIFVGQQPVISRPPWLRHWSQSPASPRWTSLGAATCISVWLCWASMRAAWLFWLLIQFLDGKLSKSLNLSLFSKLTQSVDCQILSWNCLHHMFLLGTSCSSRCFQNKTPLFGIIGQFFRNFYQFGDESQLVGKKYHFLVSRITFAVLYTLYQIHQKIAMGQTPDPLF